MFYHVKNFYLIRLNIFSTFLLDNVWIFQGEVTCQSLLGVKCWIDERLLLGDTLYYFVFVYDFCFFFTYSSVKIVLQKNTTRPWTNCLIGWRDLSCSWMRLFKVSKNSTLKTGYLRQRHTWFSWTNLKIKYKSFLTRYGSFKQSKKSTHYCKGAFSALLVTAYTSYRVTVVQQSFWELKLP